MKINQKIASRSKQLDIILEKLFYNKEFINDIKILRKATKIPEDGFKTFHEYYNYMVRDKSSKRVQHYYTVLPETIKIAVKNKLPYAPYSYWIEAFMALGFNYKEFDVNTPYNSPREHFVYGASTTLDTSDMRDGKISLHIFPGASLNSTKDFLQENWGFINEMLEIYSENGKTPAVREKNKRDRLQILTLAEIGEINNAGQWLPMRIRKQEYPNCIKDIGPDQIKKIITEEKRKKKMRA